MIGVEHRATVLGGLEPLVRWVPGSTIAFVHEGRFVSYLPGDEFVVLLSWEPTLARFTPAVGDRYIIPVKNGTIIWPQADVTTLHDGMAVDDFLAALDALRANAVAK